MYVRCLNEKDSVLIHICQEGREEVVELLPAWAAPEGTNVKEEMAATLTHFFLLPILLFPSPAEIVSLLSSFKHFLIHLPFFLLSTLHLQFQLCPTVSGAEGKQKKKTEKQKPKTRGQKFSRSPGERCYFMIQCLFVLLRTGFRDLMEIRRISPSQLCSFTSVFLVYGQWWRHGYYTAP